MTSAEGGSVTEKPVAPEPTGIALEIEAIQSLITDLERMVSMWQHDRLDLGGWGSQSHEWNRRRTEWCRRIAACEDQSLAHRNAHLALSHLFDAWQRIHNRISAGRAPDLSGLEEAKRRLAVAEQAHGRRAK